MARALSPTFSVIGRPESDTRQQAAISRPFEERPAPSAGCSVLVAPGEPSPPGRRSSSW